jgi:hypothetical protein
MRYELADFEWAAIENGCGEPRVQSGSARDTELWHAQKECCRGRAGAVLRRPARSYLQHIGRQTSRNDALAAAALLELVRAAVVPYDRLGHHDAVSLRLRPLLCNRSRRCREAKPRCCAISRPECLMGLLCRTLAMMHLDRVGAFTLAWTICSTRQSGCRRASFALVHSRPPRAKCVAGEAEPCSAALAGDRECSGGLRTCRRASLLFWGRFAGERGRRCRQDFPLGRKPMLIGLAVHEAICAPDLEGALANAVFEALIHVNV